MYIKEIELKNFRNYEDISLRFHERVNIFLGDNAQGKTNLLEGIYISSFGKTFRFGKDNEMIRFGSKFCKAKISAVKENRDTSVEIVISENEKGAKIDGMKVKKTAELLENIFVVVFSPEDLKIIKGEPEKRRRFIDREISQISPAYYSELSSYKRVLLHRNALLKEKNVGKEELDIWDSELSKYGTKIIVKRNSFIKKINKISGEIHRKITNKKENLEVIYDSSVLNKNYTQREIDEKMESIDFIENFFLTKLKETVKRDIFRGNTETGPHKDDLKICINGIDIRKFGSQGQQRTAALSLKLAELQLIREETGEEAILLLDDVLSELDGERQNFLINSLQNVQIFITTTEISESIKEKLPKGYEFYIKNGTAKLVENLFLV